MARDKRKKPEVEDLKGNLRQQSKIIKHLKKELARSQKQAKLSESISSSFFDDDYESVSYQKPLENPNKIKCPKCNSKTETIDLGPKKVVVCVNKDCKHRYTKK